MEATKVSIDELRQELYTRHQDTSLEEVDFKKFTIVDDFSTFFAEWELRDLDLLIHLFPRGGEEDQYFEGRYINRCRSCRREVPQPESIRSMKPCQACGHSGLIYEAGRLEQKGDYEFPEDMVPVIEAACHAVWQGDVMYDYVKELAAYVILFKAAGTVQELTEDGGLLDRFLVKVDAALE